MLLLLHKWALRLAPFRKLCLITAALAGVATVIFLFNTVDSQTLSIRLTLLLSLWALTLFAFSSLFCSPAPVVLPALSWTERLLARLQYWLFYGMVCGFGVLLLVVVKLTIKLLVLG